MSLIKEESVFEAAVDPCSPCEELTLISIISNSQKTTSHSDATSRFKVYYLKGKLKEFSQWF